MATATSESKDASDHVVELIVRDASAPSSDESDSEDKDQIAPLLSQERPKINIFTASYPRTKPRKELKENKQKDSRALFSLQQEVDNTIFLRIIGVTSAKQAWNTVQEEFQGSKGISHLKKDCWHHGKSQCQYCKKVGRIEKYCRAGSWYLDSECSNHMVNDHSIFNGIDKFVNVKLGLGNCTTMESQGKGTFMVETKKSMKFIKDVLVVPILKEYLISIGQMIENEYSLHFEKDTCKAEVDDLRLWHRRFGHFNTHALKLLYNKNMMRDLPCLKVNNESCEGCLLGKQHRLPFSIDRAWRAKDLLELIHIDFFGPMMRSSHHNNRYFILFIDEKQSGKHIKVLRSNRGKEYTFCEFDKFFAYTTQENGVSKRKKRTVMEMAKSMLKEKSIPNTFWAEAVYIVAYILNRCPTMVVQEKTPIDA
ncbi:hypothetical protein V8G54_033613 [Vigna mungo]|uniref:GAG-pre-integrase domain-containing protein n=1 Tax=Vigna mungo TaxID=3915 RepID=A0AAQ3RJX4_VIGMU